MVTCRRMEDRRPVTNARLTRCPAISGRGSGTRREIANCVGTSRYRCSSEQTAEWGQPGEDQDPVCAVLQVLQLRLPSKKPSGCGRRPLGCTAEHRPVLSVCA